MELSNIKIYGLAESIYASGYAMMPDPPSQDLFTNESKQILADIMNKSENKHVNRAIKLMNLGHGEDNFSVGIIAQFDLRCSIKMWTEFERYKFANIVTSQSTMHRLRSMDIKKCVSKHVNPTIADLVTQIQQDVLTGKDDLCETDLLYNVPVGFELTARISTNYRCLRNIYRQRYNHKLKEWRDFCKELERFPLGKELIVYKPEKKAVGITNNVGNKKVDDKKNIDKLEKKKAKN